MMSITDVNKKLIEILSLVFELPPKITNLNLDISMNQYPSLTVTYYSETSPERLSEVVEEYSIEKICVRKEERYRDAI